ncbi:MAG TPA: DUF4031 domain-containing protein [Ktedonobacterales bacterium]|nr:DUF4031 domain-containing protein [Ktedonobacterales bacterium]
MAILVHPMLATRDLPRPGIRRGDRMYHLLSDLHGEAGAVELLAAARACGMPTRFIQYPGTYREHFDIHVPMAEKLLADGARLATNREIGQLLRAKRAALEEAEERDERAI